MLDMFGAKMTPLNIDILGGLSGTIWGVSKVADVLYWAHVQTHQHKPQKMPDSRRLSCSCASVLVFFTLKVWVRYAREWVLMTQTLCPDSSLGHFCSCCRWPCVGSSSSSLAEPNFAQDTSKDRWLRMDSGGAYNKDELQGLADLDATWAPTQHTHKKE